ncbi:MAG TPA: TIGR03435 family protein [Vicinamibacterales bacterium]|jgi:uncharacterized protein (TIGR03435 family)|nr:TIGR03435 family protein [Vicinamibacterales bacterium]
MKRLVVVLLCGLGAANIAARQPTPAFEVVSVKPNGAFDQAGIISAPTGSQFRVQNVVLRQIINYAYNLREIELVNAPGWTSAESFDITGTYPATTKPTLEIARLMLQRVLADRFQLRAHRESRELPIYRLVKAREDGRLGPNLTPSDVDCVKWLADKKPQIIGTPPIGPGGARLACAMVTQRNYIMGSTKTMRELALGLEGIVERRVVDATGLTGNFDITVQWTPGLNTVAAGDAISVFTALQDQLGLKLESARGPVDVLVVDSVQRPTPD